MNEEQLTCVLCKNPIPEDPPGWTQGHNAEPVVEGRCCTECNNGIVIPIRMLRMQNPAAVEKMLRKGVDND